jgi:hypothetical protein
LQAGTAAHRHAPSNDVTTSMRPDTHDGWTIGFKPHVHMYYHRLSATKHGETHLIPCEASSSGDGSILICLYALELEPDVLRELSDAVLQWA